MQKPVRSRKTMVWPIILILAAGAAPLTGQILIGKEFAPWYRTEEAAHMMLPVGGWNVFGAFSPQAMAMGETFFASRGPSAGLLNPAFLSGLAGPSLDLSYRYSSSSYKTASGIQIMTLDSHADDQTATFRRNTGYPDGIGLALPFEKWTFAVHYSIFQEYNTPSISGSPFSMPSKIKQSGELRAVNLAVARSLSDSFSVGISAAYLFGRISRFEVMPLIYTLNSSNNDDNVLTAALRKFLSGLLVIIPTMTDDNETDLDGFLVNFGFSYKIKSNLTFGISLRTPFAVHLKSDIARSWTGVRTAPVRISSETTFKQPFVVTGSFLFLPAPSFALTADVSFWDWKNAGSENGSIWTIPSSLSGVVKLNLGAEYRVDLNVKDIKFLALRAGFIHDPQPYFLSRDAVRNFACAGFGIGVGRFRFDAAAKFNLFDSDPGKFRTNVFSAGLSFDF